MIDLFNISDNFNKHKSTIINLLVNYYGQEYSSLINTRIKPVYINLSSTPVEDYKYSNRNADKLSSYKRKIIYLKYMLYKNIEDKSRKNNTNLLIEYASNKLQITDQSKIKRNIKIIIPFLHDENFGAGFIDAFSSEIVNLLSDENVSTNLKEKIIRDQKMIKTLSNKLGISTSSLTPNIVDEIIKNRKALQKQHKNYIAQNTQFGQKIYKDIQKEFNLELNPELLSFISFQEQAYAGVLIIKDNNNVSSFHNYIRIPLIRLINKGIKGLDVSIIHELIHKVETHKYFTGISILNDEGTNSIINEIRTQKLAIKITRELHKQGIFIYDNPKDYRIEGESTYEWLFSLTESFLDRHEDIISKCAINNDIAALNDLFGDTWANYSQYLNDLYDNNMYYYLKFRKIPNIQIEKSIYDMIEKMESEYLKKRKQNNLTKSYIHI